MQQIVMVMGYMSQEITEWNQLLNADSDGDGVNDGQEATNHNPDTDGDE
jgi:hypothetical protein